MQCNCNVFMYLLGTSAMQFDCISINCLFFDCITSSGLEMPSCSLKAAIYTMHKIFVDVCYILRPQLLSTRIWSNIWLQLVLSCSESHHTYKLYYMTTACADYMYAWKSCTWAAPSIFLPRINKKVGSSWKGSVVCEQVGKVIFSAGPLVLNMHGCGSCGQKHACVNDHAWSRQIFNMQYIYI